MIKKLKLKLEFNYCIYVSYLYILMLFPSVKHKLPKVYNFADKKWHQHLKRAEKILQEIEVG